MSRPLPRTMSALWTAVRLMVIFTVVLGILYPALILGIGQVALPAQANGSLLRAADGEITGSSLIGQSFLASDGSPLEQYFQRRPSAAGDGYDPRASGGSNLGPENPDLVTGIQERLTQIAEFNSVPESAIPADAVTASASGLDPHISPAYAQLQAARIADARNLPLQVVMDLISEHTTGPDLGFLGDARVNVVELNLALDGLSAR